MAVGMNQDTPPDLECWTPWKPADLPKLLGDHSLNYYVVGGWALDLWHGAQTRDHEDLEICVSRNDLAAVRAALAKFNHFTAHNGAVAPLPHFDEPAPHISQIWIASQADQTWKLDIMLEDGTAQDWQYKRNKSLKIPRETALHHTEDGLAFLAPELVLLFKAKHCRPKDQYDFDLAGPKLSSIQRKHLKMWLEWLHPKHPWIEALG